VLRHGYRFDGGRSYWTVRHLSWLKSLSMGGLIQETLDEYLITYECLVDKIERMDQRIEEFAADERYQEKVKKLVCFLGVKTHTALATIVEIGDFNRFAKPTNFTAFLGIVPGEDSSGEKRRVGSITKEGNSHIRRLLVESAQSYAKGTPGHKSKELKRRQAGNDPQVIAYADRANERLRRKFYRLTLNNGTHRNTAVTAVARELACFIWGMMTDNIEQPIR